MVLGPVGEVEAREEGWGREDMKGGGHTEERGGGQDPKAWRRRGQSDYLVNMGIFHARPAPRAEEGLCSRLRCTSTDGVGESQPCPYDLSAVFRELASTDTASGRAYILGPAAATLREVV